MNDGLGKSDRATYLRSPEQRRETAAEGWSKRFCQREPPIKRVARYPIEDAPSALERVRQQHEGIRKFLCKALRTTSITGNAAHGPTSLEEGSAPGVDGETWRHYGEELERNLQIFPKGEARSVSSEAGCVKKGKSVHPRPTGGQRPLGVSGAGRQNRPSARRLVAERYL